jgi:ankyrin repeat domain-containing protein 50
MSETNDVQMGAMLASVDKITRVISRGQIFELVFSREPMDKPALDNLQSTLVELYSAALMLLADVSSLFSQNTAMRFLHAVTHPGKSDGLLSTLSELEDQLQRDAQLSEVVRGAKADSRLKELVQGLDTAMNRADKKLDSLLDMVGEAELERILGWVSTIPVGSYHKAIRERRTSNTCDWLLQHEEFEMWKATKGISLLWLRGSRK